MRTLSAARLAEFTYTVLLAPAPLRHVTNWVIRALLPSTVTRGPAVIVLNPRDPVVSGALALSVYEPSEQAFVEANCPDGTLFVDVGANVGLYTALAANCVGASGRVVALEPDAVSRAYLEQTIVRNHPERVSLYPVAATATAGERTLFVSAANRGDNRLVPHAGSNQAIIVEGSPIDDLLAGEHLEDRHLFLKIDVQGGEGEVIAGARAALRRAAAVTLLMEFWPDGLRDAGSDPVGLLGSLEESGLVLYELVDGSSLALITSIDDFTARFRGRRYSNIVGRRESQLAA